MWESGIWGLEFGGEVYQKFQAHTILILFGKVRVKAQGPPRPRTPLHKRFSPIPGGPGVVVVGGAKWGREVL